MNDLSNPIGQERTDPASCGIGNWVPSAMLPNWPMEWCRDRSLPDTVHGDPMIFKPLPYIDGESRDVWIRIA